MIGKILDFFADRKKLAWAIFAASSAALGSALIGEYVFHFRPCILCLTQRVPYALNMLFAIAAVVASYRHPRITSLLLWAIFLSFTFNMALAGYQAGMEYKWWDNFLSNCGIGKIGTSVEDLQKMFAESTSIVPCDKPQFTFLGISFAGYNFLVSMIAVLVLPILLIRKTAK